MKIICFVFGLLVILGCATDKRPQIVGRWKVSGTDNVVTLTNKDHSARLTSGGKTMIGSFEWLAPDLLKLTFPGSGPQSKERIIAYKTRDLSLNGIAYYPNRSLKVFTDTEAKTESNGK